MVGSVLCWLIKLCLYYNPKNFGISSVFQEFWDFVLFHKQGVENMYESTKIAEAIKGRSKSVGVQLKDMLIELKLNKNTLSSMYNGSMPKCDSLARIADYLDCSVDYLLGRTDIPSVTQEFSKMESSAFSFQSVGQMKELVDIYSTLDSAQQNSVLTLAKSLAARGALPSSAEEMLAEAK